jgi:hypothetical protein
VVRSLLFYSLFAIRYSRLQGAPMPNDVHPLRLDRSRYHSSEHGDFTNEVRFWQDGLPFDAHGELCTELCDGEQLAKADAKAPKTKPKALLTEPGGVAPADDPIEPGAVNLELWAKGEARYVPAKVFAAIRERYSKSVSTFADAIEFLVDDAKLIPASQASQKLLAAGGSAPVREEA